MNFHGNLVQARAEKKILTKESVENSGPGFSQIILIFDCFAPVR
jgi:hypothetical protein